MSILFKMNLEFLMNVRGLSRMDLAKELKVSKARVGQFFSPNANPTLETIAAIARVLDMPPSFLIEFDINEDVLHEGFTSEDADRDSLDEFRQALFKFQTARWQALLVAESSAKKRLKKKSK